MINKLVLIESGLGVFSLLCNLIISHWSLWFLGLTNVFMSYALLVLEHQLQIDKQFQEEQQ